MFLVHFVGSTFSTEWKQSRLSPASPSSFANLLDLGVALNGMLRPEDEATKRSCYPFFLSVRQTDGENMRTRDLPLYVSRRSLGPSTSSCKIARLAIELRRRLLEVSLLRTRKGVSFGSSLNNGLWSSELEAMSAPGSPGSNNGKAYISMIPSQK